MFNLDMAKGAHLFGVCVVCVCACMCVCTAVSEWLFKNVMFLRNVGKYEKCNCGSRLKENK